jgi:hypothetical protein
MFRAYEIVEYVKFSVGKRGCLRNTTPEHKSVQTAPCWPRNLPYSCMSESPQLSWTRPHSRQLLGRTAMSCFVVEPVKLNVRLQRPAKDTGTRMCDATPARRLLVSRTSYVPFLSDRLSQLGTQFMHPRRHCIYFRNGWGEFDVQTTRLVHLDT